MLQKVQILNRIRLWNCFLWGSLPEGCLTDGLVERDHRQTAMVEFVKGLGIPNSPTDWKHLNRIWTNWKYDYNKKINLEKATGSKPVKWTEADGIIREIMAGNRHHVELVQVRFLKIISDLPKATWFWKDDFCYDL